MEFLDANFENDPVTMPALSYHVAREEQDARVRKAQRMIELDQEVPCQQSRVRAYTARLDSIADANVLASNEALLSSVSPLRASAKAPPQLGSIGQEMVHTPQVLHVSHGTPLTQSLHATGRQAKQMLSPLGRIQCVETTTLPHDAELGMPVGAEVALGEIDSLRREISELEGSLAELRGSQVLSTLGRPVKPPRNLQALREITYAKTHVANDGWRPSLKVPALHAGPLSQARQRQENSTIQPLFASLDFDSGKPKQPLLPASRKEAKVLQDLLDKNLPPGSISMKIQNAIFQPESAAGVSLVDLAVLEREFKLVDSVQRAAAEQVSGSCAQRGKIFDTIRQRYGEFFLVLSRLMFRVQEDLIAKAEELRRRELKLEAETENVSKLQDALAACETSFKISEQERQSIQNEFDLYREESKELLAQMQSDKRSLEATLGHFEQRLHQSDDLRAEAISDATGALEEDLAHLIDERDDLLQRVRFFERQMAKLQAGMTDQDISIEHQATQTDFVDIADGTQIGTKAADGDAPDTDDEYDGLEMADQDSMKDASIISPVGAKKGKKKGGKKKHRAKTKRNLGGFGEFITSDKVGRIKSRSWVIKTISQVYADKIVADATDDREHNDRQELCEYVFDWHLNRFGLKQLAEANVLDLIVSCRAYAKDNVKIRLFSHFTGLVDTASPFRESTEHIDFYLLCLSHLAGQGVVTSLFPDTDEGIAWLRPAKVLNSIKNIFLAVQDPERHKDFMTDKVEPLQDSKTGMIDADVLLLVLLEYWSRHLDMNTAHLKALFRAGDTDDDGFLTYDEFISLAMLVDDSIPDFRLAKLYRQALKATGGPDMVNVDAFVLVMRKAGQSIWRIHWNEAEGLEDSLSFDSSMEPNPDDMFEILDSVLATTVPSLEDQLRTVRDKIADENTILNMEKLYRSFMTKYSSRIDPEGAWLAYRLLVGKIAAILFQYRTGRLPTPPGGVSRAMSSKMLMEDIEANSAAKVGAGSVVGRSHSPPDARAPATRSNSSLRLNNSRIHSPASNTSSVRRRSSPPRNASPPSRSQSPSLNTSNVHNAVDGTIDQFPQRPPSVEQALQRQGAGAA